MFNPLTRIRHRCPFCGTTPFIFEWEGRYMYYCAVHLDGPYADTREEAWDKWCGMGQELTWIIRNSGRQ